MGKIYVEGDINNIKVGMCRIRLSDSVVKNGNVEISRKKNSPVVLYDTSGAYGDNSLEVNYKDGLPKIREPWFAGRRDIVRHNNSLVAKANKYISQIYYAKKRVITPEMEYVAIRENQQLETLGLKSYITPDFVRKEIASGRAVIPANINHLELEPMIIGNRFLVKVNNNISYGGNFSKSDAERVRLNCCSGADVLMDLSYASAESGKKLIINSPVPIATSPIYQALNKAGGNAGDLSWNTYRDTLIEQLESGVDIISIHAAMRRKHIKMAANRLTGIVSKTGNILAEWMEHHQEENFLHTYFGEICEIVGRYDAVISLGCCMRPGSVYDANDRAQFAELAEMRALVETALNSNVQIMAECPGHIPMNKIEDYVKEFRYQCKNIPLFSPSLLTSDLALGYENIAGVIGGVQMAWYGASLIGSLKANASSDNNCIKNDLICYKITAHTADLAKGHPGAQVRDNALSKARYEGRKKDCINLSFTK